MQCVGFDHSHILVNANVNVVNDTTIEIVYDEKNNHIGFSIVEEVLEACGTGYVKVYDDTNDEVLYKYIGYIRLDSVEKDGDGAIHVTLIKPDIESRIDYLCELMSEIRYGNGEVKAYADTVMLQNEKLLSNVIMDQIR